MYNKFVTNFLKPYYPLILVFLVAIVLRFLYFPDNTYVSYDTARDALTSLEVLKGDIKIVGPYSSFNNFLHHGPLVYYIWAPILYLSGGSPEVLSFFTRLYNALGALLIFFIAKELFNKKVGLIAALLFAFSYEQSQFALFLGHPTYAVLPVMLFYLGFVLIIFKKKPWGLILMSLGVGAAINFHYANAYLFINLFLFLVLFRKTIFSYPIKYFIRAIFVLTLTLFTFIIAEIKYGFPMISEIIKPEGLTGAAKFHLDTFINVFYRITQDNFFNHHYAVPFLITAIAGYCYYLISRSKEKEKIIFLLIWLISGGFIYLLTGSTAYYYSAGSSVGLLIIAGLIFYDIYMKKRIVAVTILGAILISNVFYIIAENRNGPNKHVIIQPDMILRNQKMMIDYMYQSAEKQPFAINGITVPLYIKTTWSYLFEWYGMKKYNYLPVWGGKAADGYPGNLQVVSARTSLPKLSYLIIEPQIGISDSIYRNFIREENYFSKVIEEKRFGSISVQKREKID